MAGLPTFRSAHRQANRPPPFSNVKSDSTTSLIPASSRKLLPGLLLLLVCSRATAANSLVTMVSFSPNLAIPDGSTVGVADIRTVDSEIQVIQSVQVTLSISGGWNGDYYAYLRHGDGFSVLLNRVGVTADDSEGYGDSGVSVVTFADDAANGDVHVYQQVNDPKGGPLTGTWQPDGRNVNPGLVLDTTPRTTSLGSFQNLPASGNWTLFVADRSGGGTEGILTNWGMTITGAVPEPGSSALLLGAAALGMRRRRR